MNKLLNIIFLLFLAVSCKSQNPDLDVTEYDSFKRIMGEKSWGFVNQNGDTIIPLNKYKFLNPIDDEGMILAQLNGKSGYINIKQDILIPFIYDDLSVFSHGLAPAKKNGKYGYIDRKGKIIIPFKYDNESHFYKCGLARAKLNGKYGFIDQSGNEIIPIQFEKVRDNKIDSLVCVMKNGKWAFFSCSGEQLTEFKYEEITESYYDDENYTYFQKGGCRVKKNGKVSYINNEFNEIVPFGTYEFGEPFRNYLAIVAQKGKYGIIDTLGKVIMPIEYDLIEHPIEYSNESNLFAIRKGQNIQLLDSSAKPITGFDIKEFEWDSYKTENSYQRYFVLTNSSGMTGTVSDKGIKEIPFEYQEIKAFDGKSVTYAKKNGKYGLIDCKGNIILSMEYDEIVSGKFFDYYIVKNSEKTGLFDKNGNQIISFSYQDITPVFYDQNEKFIVQQNSLYGVIDIKENVIIPIEYEEISNWVEYGPKEHFVTKNGKKGLISRDGKIVIPTQYDEIFVDNSKVIKVKNEGLYGTVDWDNRTIHSIKYEQILWEWPYLRQKSLDTIYVKENGKYFSTDTDGKVIEPSISKKLIDDKFGYLLEYE